MKKIMRILFSYLILIWCIPIAYAALPDMRIDEVYVEGSYLYVKGANFADWMSIEITFDQIKKDGSVGPQRIYGSWRSTYVSEDTAKTSIDYLLNNISTVKDGLIDIRLIRDDGYDDVEVIKYNEVELLNINILTDKVDAVEKADNVSSKEIETQLWENPFSDVPYYHKNGKAIQYLYSKGIINGYPDGTFKAGNYINRAELMKILVEGKGIKPDKDVYKDCFPDVGSEWFAPYICYAKENGWVEGYPDGSFRPAQNLNKVEAIKMLLNSQGISIPAVKQRAFNDINANEWYAPYIYRAKELNLLEETGYIYFPDKEMKRGPISESLYRTIDFLASNSGSKRPRTCQEENGIGLPRIIDGIEYCPAISCNEGYSINQWRCEKIGAEEPVVVVTPEQPEESEESTYSDTEATPYVWQDTDGDTVPDAFDLHPYGGDKVIVKNYAITYYAFNDPYNPINGTEIEIIIKVPQDLYYYYSNYKSHGLYFYGEHSNLSSFAIYDDPVIVDISIQALELFNLDQNINPVTLMQLLVWEIVYTDDINTGYGEYPKYPAETIVDGSGDCEDTTFLLAALYKAFDYDVYLVKFPNHLGLAIAVPDDLYQMNIQQQGEDYLWQANQNRPKDSKLIYVETTGIWLLGEMPLELRYLNYEVFSID